MKQIFLIFTCLLFTMQAKAAESGDGWSLSDDGTLTISADFSGSSIGDYPWDSYRESIKKVIINEGVTSIGGYAFYGCSGLESINISESVTSIGELAFAGCSSLTSINIPEGVTSIGNQAFWECSSLTSINIPESVTSIGLGTFKGCSSLTSINIPEGVTSIGLDAFVGCSSLTSINIPESVTAIGNWAFFYCSSLTSINIPSSVTLWGDQAFSGCSGLESIKVDEDNTKYDSRDNCNAIIETESNTLIVGYQNTIIPESVTAIGDQAFRGCSSLTSIIIPEGVTAIESGAFSGCSSLSSINIPQSVTSIGLGDQAFSGCSSLESIKVDEDNTKYDSRDNCNAIIETKSNTLIAGCQNTIIPEGVTSIGNQAFWECSSLTSINIPESVTFIDYRAFEGCSSLSSINIPEGVTSIGQRAFSFCSGLTSINIPESVTSIGGSAFYGCSSLSSVYSYATTPAKLGYEVFKVFNGANENLIIYIPKGTTEAYKAAWGEELNFVEMLASFEYDSNYGEVKILSSEADAMTISIAPAEGYELQSITVNDNDILSAANDATLKAVLNADDTYTISGLTEDNMVVVVNFGAAVVTPVQNTASNQEAEIAAVYSLTGAYVGKSLENLQNGLYVVVYSNGKIDKVLVK